ncbi:SusC/RagA family TonB-linked outer membrane protein [Proteiniphilum sp. UBA5384]|uniref:SusC/RagA family TonB-linked outer membrane protein n=1 Tax=Proteiniphilum sp. UBA5384 TaxID=1947279 RepID=UPI0025D3D966|nr:TonB-dependent receptor [Proteiniphilum sp. UBA5384]
MGIKMDKMRRIILSVALLCWVGIGNLSAMIQNIASFPAESMLHRLERLNEIGKATGQSVSYNATEIQNENAPAFNAETNNMEEWLYKSLGQSEFTYEKRNNNHYLVIRNRQAKPEPEEIQQVSVLSGRVTDIQNEPLIGVNIVEKGTSNGTVTDIDGRYSLSVPADVVIVFSYIGYTTRETPRNGRNLIDIVLNEDSELLEEVVVVGYGTQRKINLTGAVASLDGNTLSDRSGYSVSQMIQGKVPGLTITPTSGRPGAGSGINIRGVNSINKGNPLVIVDGIEGDLETINANDIESISVLKDASASAIYGARAAFGVILVTTKAGETGKTQIKYNGQFGWSKNTTSTDYETRGYYSVYLNDLFWRSYAGNSYTLYNEDDYNELWIRRNDKVENPERPWVVIDQRDGRDSYTYYGNTDWYGYLYNRTRPSMNHNISLRGGTETASYFVSIGYHQSDGIMKTNTDRYRKFDFRAKMNFKINEKMDFSTNVSYLNNSYKYPGVGGVNTAFSLDKVHGLASIVPENPDGSMVYSTSLSRYVVMDGLPLVLKNPGNKNEDKRDQTSLIGEYTYRPIEGLQLKTNFNYRYNSQGFMNRQTNGVYSKYPGVKETLTTGRFEDKLYERINTHNYYAFNAFSTYTKSLAEKNNFQLMLGYNWEKQTYKDLKATGWNLTDDSLSDLNLVGQDADGNKRTEVGGGYNEFSIMGFFGRLNYNYDGKYLFEFSGRYDGTSRFRRDNRWAFSPSASAGWRISEEEFFGGAKKWLEDVKIRLSYGTLGNQQVGYYDHLRLITIETQNNYLFGGDNKPVQAKIGAPTTADLTWEKAIHYNAGVDMSTLRNRLNFTGDFYIRDTKDMLGESVALPGVYGASAPRANSADLRSRGYELTLSWRDSHTVLGEKLSYGVTLTFNDYISFITKYDNPDKSFAKKHYKGKRLGEIWGYRVGGLFASDEEAAQYTSVVDQSYVNEIILQSPGPEGKPRGGDLKFLDLDGDNIILPGTSVNNPRDQVIIGNSEPRYHYGATFNASWYGMDFSAFFQGIGKRDWYPEPNTMAFWHMYARPYATYIPKNFHTQFWTEENPGAYFPRPRGYTALQGSKRQLTAVNDRYLQSLAYLRLKNLTIGYTLPKRWTKAAKIENMRIYITGENLVTWSPGLKSDYIDPESVVTNSIYGDESNLARNYPWSKTYTVGIDISF